MNVCLTCKYAEWQYTRHKPPRIRHDKPGRCRIETKWARGVLPFSMQGGQSRLSKRALWKDQEVENCVCYTEKSDEANNWEQSEPINLETILLQLSQEASRIIGLRYDGRSWAIMASSGNLMKCVPGTVKPTALEAAQAAMQRWRKRSTTEPFMREIKP